MGIQCKDESGRFGLNSVVSVFDQRKIVIGRVCPVCKREFSIAEEHSTCPHDGALLSVITTDPLAGETVGGKYEVLEQIGAGGWSVVYKAKQVGLTRLVCLKVLHPHLASDPEKVLRFQREAEAASAVLSPNVAAVFDFGVLPQGQPYLVLEYLDGTSLADILHTQGTLTMERLVPLFLQALTGLAAAHEKGVVHRDIKPSNLFIADGATVKILDFGLAKLTTPEADGFSNLTQTGQTLGTPSYMSPEQCSGLNIDHRSDIYSLGCVMYEALTGRPPFSGRNAFECMQKHVNEVPPRFSEVDGAPKVPETIELAVMRALQKDPAARYQSVGEFKAALRMANEGQGSRRSAGRVLARLFPRKASFSKRGEVMWPVIGAALSIVLLMAVWRYVEVSVHSLADHTPAAPPGVQFAEQFEKNYIEGKKLLDEDDYPQAALFFKESVQQAEFFGEADDRLRRALEALRETYGRMNDIKNEQKIARRLDSIRNRMGDEDFGDKDRNAARIVSLSLKLQQDKNDRQAVEQLAKTLNDQATIFYGEAQYGKAKELIEQAQVLLTSTARGADPLMGRTVSNLAFVSSKLGDDANAEVLYKQALAIREAALGPHHRDVARSRRNLAEFYRLTDRPRQAEPLMRRALADYRGLDGETSADIAWCLNVLGLIYADRHDYDQALNIQLRAYKMRVKVLGRDNIDTARSLYNLGRTHVAKNDLGPAEKELQDALAILTKTAGTDNPETISAVYSLGDLYQRKGDLPQAERQYKRALNIARRIGPTDPHTNKAYQQLIAIYRKQGRLDEAQKLTARVLQPTAAAPTPAATVGGQGSNR